MFINFVLITALLICLITDIKNKKILNIVTLPVILFGFIYYTVFEGFEGLLFSGAGFLLGFSLLLIPYILGGMGAGDVKLMAAIGALMGTSFVFNSFIYIALIGGLISAVLIMKKNGVKNSLRSFTFHIIFFKENFGPLLFNKDKSSSISFPYGIAIVFGTLCNFVWGGVL